MLCKIHDMENIMADSGVNLDDEDPVVTEQPAREEDNISVRTQESNVTATSSTSSSGDAGKFQRPVRIYDQEGGGIDPYSPLKYSKGVQSGRQK